MRTVRVMIEMYCRAHHGAVPGGLCPECAELWEYSRQRVERCPFGRDKPTCLRCTVHCFRAEARDRIRAVMRYAGPRMSVRHPILSLLHLLDGRRRTDAGAGGQRRR
ncbi:MAG: nitrous oxide-stimulated promoter family protein [Myxococcales bacterium]|nr:nitrous oxide-stimulated promoter family protein [Myxococcales bacterium]